VYCCNNYIKFATNIEKIAHERHDVAALASARIKDMNDSLIIAVKNDLAGLQRGRPYRNSYGSSEEFFKGDRTSSGNANSVESRAEPHIPKKTAKGRITGVGVQM